jgi:hypothetical protein
MIPSITLVRICPNLRPLAKNPSLQFHKTEAAKPDIEKRSQHSRHHVFQNFRPSPSPLTQVVVTRGVHKFPGIVHQQGTHLTSKCRSWFHEMPTQTLYSTRQFHKLETTDSQIGEDSGERFILGKCTGFGDNGVSRGGVFAARRNATPIALLNLAHHFGGVACDDNHGRDIFGDHSAGSDDGAVADCDSGEEDGAAADPDAVADGDGQAELGPVEAVAQGGVERVAGAVDLDVGAEQDVVADGHLGAVQDDAPEVHVAVGAELDVEAVVALERRLDERRPLGVHLAQQLAQDPRALRLELHRRPRRQAREVVPPQLVPRRPPLLRQLLALRPVERLRQRSALLHRPLHRQLAHRHTSHSIPPLPNRFLLCLINLSNSCDNFESSVTSMAKRGSEAPIRSKTRSSTRALQKWLQQFWQNSLLHCGGDQYFRKPQIEIEIVAEIGERSHLNEDAPTVLIRQPRRLQKMLHCTGCRCFMKFDQFQARMKTSLPCGLGRDGGIELGLRRCR